MCLLETTDRGKADFKPPKIEEELQFLTTWWFRHPRQNVQYTKTLKLHF